MKIGDISDKDTWLTHKTATTEILRLAKEHPDYPIIVLVGESANPEYSGWMLASSVSVGIEEILECHTEWWPSDCACTDRDDFEGHAKDLIWVKLWKKLDREPTDAEIEAAWEEVKKAHEPYWKKCIAIRADNY